MSQTAVRIGDRRVTTDESITVVSPWDGHEVGRVPTCTADVERDGWDVVAPVTLVDIASFRPASATHHMQPNGWTIAGLPTNFYARTGTQIVPGTLLGRPAEVRFTPVQYYWDYGDGSSATRSRPGGTWAALGVAEFDVTPTSPTIRELTVTKKNAKTTTSSAATARAAATSERAIRSTLEGGVRHAAGFLALAQASGPAGEGEARRRGAPWGRNQNTAAAGGAGFPDFS